MINIINNGNYKNLYITIRFLIVPAILLPSASSMYIHPPKTGPSAVAPASSGGTGGETVVRFRICPASNPR